jgi:ankyrin repeat protein
VILHSKSVKDTVQAPDGRCAVHFAAQAGHRDALLYLLKNMGSDIDACDAQGCTPLMCAMNGNHMAIVQALIMRGASCLVVRPSDGAHPSLVLAHAC